MTTFTYTITDPVGIHARPAGLMVKAAQGFESNIMIEKSGKPAADMKKLFAVMGLAVKCGETVAVRADGSDEAKAAAALEAFFKEHY